MGGAHEKSRKMRITCHDKSINHEMENMEKEVKMVVLWFFGYVLLSVPNADNTPNVTCMYDHNNNNENSNELWRMNAAATMASKSLFCTSFTACFAFMHSNKQFPLLFRMEMILLRVAATCLCKQPQNSTIKKRTNRFHVILIFMFFLGYKGNVVIVVSRQYTEICFNRTISNGMLIIYFRHKMCPTTHEQAWLITVGVLSVVGAV